MSQKICTKTRRSLIVSMLLPLLSIRLLAQTLPAELTPLLPRFCNVKGGDVSSDVNGNRRIVVEINLASAGAKRVSAMVLKLEKKGAVSPYLSCDLAPVFSAEMERMDASKKAYNFTLPDSAVSDASIVLKLEMVNGEETFRIPIRAWLPELPKPRGG